MIPQSKGKIFLAAERGVNELEWYRSYNTFNFGRYQHQHKAAVGTFYVLNEDTLAGGKSIKMIIEDESCIILIPVVGAIEYADNLGNTGIVQAGGAQVLNIPKDGFIQISNPYESDLVNFLQLWFKTGDLISYITPQLFSFDLDHNKNQLLSLFNSLNAPFGYIGQFDGRAETTYRVNNPDHVLFAFVIEGKFEVQYRLMHARDGLALWDVKKVEIEALSNDAIILLLEFPVN